MNVSHSSNSSGYLGSGYGENTHGHVNPGVLTTNGTKQCVCNLSAISESVKKGVDAAINRVMVEEPGTPDKREAQKVNSNCVEKVPCPETTVVKEECDKRKLYDKVRPVKITDGEKLEYEEYVKQLEQLECCRHRKVVLCTNKEEMCIPAEVLIGENEVGLTMLIDTGATRSFVSQKFFDEKLKMFVRKRRNGLKFYGVGRQALLSSGEVELDVRIGDDIVRHVFIVAEIEDDGVIGFDFCKTHRLEWKWQEEMVILHSTPGQTVHDKGKEVPSVARIRVITCESETIPGRSEKIIKGRLSKGWHASEGMIECDSNFIQKHAMGVAAVLCDGSKGEVPVRLINVNDREVHVSAHTVVGDYLPVQVIEETEKLRTIKQTTSSPWNPRVAYPDLPSELTEEEKERFYALLEKYGDLFAGDSYEISSTTMTKHHIVTGDHPPIKQRPRRAPLHLNKVIKDEIDKMLEKKIIEPSTSPWASPIVLVDKKDGSTRFCVDYRRLNEVTVKDAYPLPRIEDNLDSLHGSQWFSTLDLASGYWQVEVAEEDREKTAFCTRQGLHHFLRMPFGLCNAPGTFERLMETVLRGLQWEQAVLYLDDIIVFSKNASQHLQRLENVLDRLKNAQLKLKVTKCQFFKKETEFLGHIVSADGVRTSSEKTEKVREMKVPTRLKDVRAFLGLTGYYRRFIKDYGQIAKPLHQLTEKGQPFVWGEEQQQAFEKLQEALVTAPILGYPSQDSEDMYVLDTDASNCHIGAVLSQIQSGKETVLAYGSKVLSKAERNYCVTRKELLAVVHFVVHYKHYLVGKKFLVRTDHGALRWLFNFKEPEGQLARWLETLSSYDFDIVHRPGRLHGNGDGMSRVPCPSDCPTCRRSELKQEEKVLHRRVKSETVRETRGRAARDRKRNAFVNHWIKVQREDPVIAKVMSWTEKPEWSEVSGEHPEVKHYWSRWDQLRMEDGLLRYRWIDRDSERLKMVVPMQERRAILSEHHNDKLAGHFGVLKTVGRLRESPYYWPRMKQSVEDWIRRCDVCCTTKPALKKEVASMGKLLTGAPLERVAVDVMGPLPVTDRGNKYLVVIGDYFTKWMEAVPTPDHKADTIARTLITHFVSKFGIPLSLHSDQGRDFESQLFKEMCKLLGIEKTRTTPWHPQSDGLVERFNRTLETMLKQTIKEDQSDWDLQAPLCCMAYRAATHETTRQTPNMMMLGRNLSLPSYLQAEPPEQKACGTTHAYSQELAERMQRAHEMARKSQVKGFRYQQRQYDKRMHGEKFEPGDLVWLYNPTRTVGRSPKLQRGWETVPYEVKARVGEAVYRIQRVKSGKNRVVHRNSLTKVRDVEAWEETKQ